jgi:SAM-dependent methyltransferase
VRRGDNRLSPEASENRYAEEIRQGDAIVTEELESVWGWSGPAGILRADRRAEFLVRAARLGPGVKCLELGCGTGEFTSRLVRSGCDLAAIELSEATAARCRERVQGAAEIIVGNVETGEGLEGRSFDALVGVSVLHHVNMDLCLRNTFPALRPGGRFAFSEPNMANPQIWAERHLNFVRRRRRVTEHETAFRPRALRILLEDAGLVVEGCEPFDFLHPSTPRALIPAVKRLEGGLEASVLRGIAGSVRVAGLRP